MSEKQVAFGTFDSSPLRHPLAGRRNRYHLIPLILGATALLYWLNTLTGSLLPCHNGRRAEGAVGRNAASKVTLEAHIMSKCPDARDCLNDLVVPAMQDISSLVDFKLSYIGTIDNHTGAVECKHGPSECMGNIIDLCAAHLYPEPKIYLGFATCLTNEYDSIPDQDFVKGCALEHDVDFDELNECVSKDYGAYGQDMLKESVNATANAGVTLSCTVRLNEETRCIRDGGEWKDCPGGPKPADLIRDIKQLQR
ncbi:MAG: hypothetical protein Q9162_005090 [Coniocarpon cinnabarinum]